MTTAVGVCACECVWLHCVREPELVAPVSLRLQSHSCWTFSSAASRRRACIIQSESRERSVHTRTRTDASKLGTISEEGNMTSSYNLDFLPDMMVESRLLVSGDRM